MPTSTYPVTPGELLSPFLPFLFLLPSFSLFFLLCFTPGAWDLQTPEYQNRRKPNYIFIWTHLHYWLLPREPFTSIRQLQFHLVKLSHQYPSTTSNSINGSPLLAFTTKQDLGLRIYIACLCSLCSYNAYNLSSCSSHGCNFFLGHVPCRNREFLKHSRMDYDRHSILSA